MYYVNNYFINYKINGNTISMTTNYIYKTKINKYNNNNIYNLKKLLMNHT